MVKLALLAAALALHGCYEQVGVPGWKGNTVGPLSLRTAFFDPAFGIVCYTRGEAISCVKVAEGTALADEKTGDGR